MRIQAVLLLAPVIAAGVALADDAAVPKVDSERDLALELVFEGPKEVWPGGELPFAWKLTNRSKDTTYRYVLPGDGSESGWREPHVYYRAERMDENGQWKAVEPRGIGRCGLYDADWHDEVKELSPGASVNLKDWAPYAGYAFDPQIAGRVRLTAHYVFRAKAPSKETLSPKAPPEGLGPMKGVEPFHLVSNQAVIEIVRPFAVEATPVGKVEPGKLQKLSELLDLRLVNRSEKPIEIDPKVWSWSIARWHDAGLEVNQLVGAPVDVLRKLPPRTLKPGDSVALLGPKALQPGFDVQVRFAAGATKAPKIQIMSQRIEGGMVQMLSDLLEIPLAP